MNKYEAVTLPAMRYWRDWVISKVDLGEGPLREMRSRKASRPTAANSDSRESLQKKRQGRAQ